ncbi:MAG: CHAT domain-containing protein [Candidatus Rokubacteria bacterium]|nr:CHAT domain-containing protein [Candidatus Rokubacteria bacterium]
MSAPTGWIHWHRGATCAIVDVRTLLGVVADRTDVDWIIFERHEAWRATPYYYAFRPQELRDVIAKHPADAARPALEALDLHEWGESPPGEMSSNTTTHPMEFPPKVVSSNRVVAREADGTWRVGDVHPGPPKMANGGTRRSARRPAGAPDALAMPTSRRASDDAPPAASDLGTMRSTTAGAVPAPAGGPPPAAAPPARVEGLFSAEAPSEIRVDEVALVDVRLEVAATASPLAHVLPTTFVPAEQITVIVNVERALAVVGPRLFNLDPPTADTPTVASFQVRGVKAADAAGISLMFSQGGATLGAIAFKTSVVTQPAQPAAMLGAARAVARRPVDDEVLQLLVTEEQQGDSVHYRYLVYCKALRLNYKEYRSKPLLKAAGAGSAPLAWVEKIHAKIVERKLETPEHFQTFARELTGNGAAMSRQLFDPDLVDLLWNNRQRLQIVQVTSWEPYIPWELVRLENPRTQEVDDRFLAEYGLVRTLSGNMPPDTLAAKEWRYLFGDYPNGSLPRVAAEAPYLTKKLKGVSLRAIDPTPLALLDAVGNPDFDVLHVSCHGETSMAKMDETALVLTDERSAGGDVSRVKVDATTLSGAARLAGRQPLVFLNACETGRTSPSLTEWGGWSRAFFERGAGAFVGTSWSVYDKPAAAFAQAFYEAFRAGKTLAEAASAARAAAKKFGDASWLAYVVYGDPLARVSTDA